MQFRYFPLVAIGMILALLAGCAQPTAFQDHDGLSLYARAGLPPMLETAPQSMLAPVIPHLARPASVLDPERTPYHLSLNEAIALALENGTVGIQSVNVPGLASDDLGGFTGQGISSSDSIRVLSYQPARLGAAVEAGMARFDPIFTTDMLWNTTDEPTQGLSSFSNGHGARLASSLIKPLSTGGVLGITFSTDYELLSNPPGGSFSVLNPSYTPRLRFGFEQPLLRGFGVDINQWRSSFPGSNLFGEVGSRSSSYASEGILITRLRFDQQRVELERNVNFLLLNVQAAYWNLYGAYVNLYVTSQGLKQSHLAWSIGKEQFAGGKIDNAHLSLMLAQYEQFRADRVQALGRVLDSERQLRALLGMPVEDGRRLVPIDTPMTLPVVPDWQSAVAEALTLRPELVMARQDIQARHGNLLVQKNNLLPDLRLEATHTTTGLGSRLDGNEQIPDANGDLITNNALRSLASHQFNSWTVGLRLNVPLGYRFENAQLRDARLALTQSYLLLKMNEQKAINYLAKQYSQTIEKAKLIEIRRQQRLAQGEQVETRFQKFAAGIKDSPLEFLLQAQQQWAFALNQEYQAIVDYNIALAQWEFAKGTIMPASRVRILEGALPESASERAVVHERHVSEWQVAHQKQRSQQHHPLALGAMPFWPEYSGASLVALEHSLPLRVSPPMGLGQPRPQFGVPNTP